MTSRTFELRRPNAQEVSAIALGVWCGVIALMPSTTSRLLLLIPPLLAGLFCWILLRPSRWLALFFVFALLAPPLPFPLGNSGIHVAPMCALLGLLASLAWIREWRSWSHPVTVALIIFMAILMESLAFAALYSGWAIAVGSLARVVLFGMSVFIFLYAYAGPTALAPLRITRFLFGLAVAGALFACADFYFQFPVPAGYGDQFVYLEEGVFRRAQGLFYEASTLGNVCAFFLVMVMVSLFRRRQETPVSRASLYLGAIILAGALLFSYSRASVVNVCVAAAVLASIHGGRARRSLMVLALALVAAAGAIELAAPKLSANYWGRLLGSFSFFGESPDRILSGRLGHWRVLYDFLAHEPWHAVFGIGYKTLPYSTFVGSKVIADNTYLGLLVETGVVGLAAFIGLNLVILRTAWLARRSARPQAQFFGEWIFCFWCGQLVQMLTGDLITYWRVLPVYFWVLGTAAQLTREDV